MSSSDYPPSDRERMLEQLRELLISMDRVKWTSENQAPELSRKVYRWSMELTTAIEQIGNGMDIPSPTNMSLPVLVPLQLSMSIKDAIKLYRHYRDCARQLRACIDKYNAEHGQ